MEPDDIAPDPAAAQQLAQLCTQLMWGRDLASQALGITVSEVGPGRACAAMSARADQVNGHGIAHGGFVFTLADTAFAFACNTHGNVTVAAGADIVFVSPAMSGDQLIAIAEERSRTGRNGVYDVTVRRHDGTLVAEFRGRSRETAASLLDG